jgi:hypothetical protein
VTDPIDVAVRVAAALNGLGISHTIGGSLASSFAGEPRSTVDIDIVAAVDGHHVDPLVNALAVDFYVHQDALERAVRDREYIRANAPVLDVADLADRPLSESDGVPRTCLVSRTRDAPTRRGEGCVPRTRGCLNGGSGRNGFPGRRPRRCR